jgi:hypothetical protein
LILEKWEQRQAVLATRKAASRSLYTSGARAVSSKKCYRIYADRVELDCPRFFKKTFVVQASEIIDVWAGAGPTLRDISRLGGVFAAFRCLKLDMADVFRHVVLKSRRAGYFKSFAFVPERPDEFVDVIQKKLLSCGADAKTGR